MVYGTYNYSIPGAFVNQRSHHWGASHWATIYQYTFGSPFGLNPHDPFTTQKKNCRFPKAPIAVPKFKFSKLLVPKVWQCRPGKIKLKLQNKFSENWKVKRWGSGDHGDLSQSTNLLASLRSFKTESDRILSGRISCKYCPFLISGNMIIHSPAEKNRVLFVNYKYQLNPMLDWFMKNNGI